MKNNSGKLKVVLAILIVVVTIIVVFYRIANQKRADEGVQKLSSTQAILQRDLDINYPQSPRAVVKYYAELSQCMYESDTTETDIVELAVQSRKLLDDELVAQQSDEQYLAALKKTVESFAKEKRRIVSFTISSSTDVETYKNNGDDMASLYFIFVLQKGSLNYSDNEQYILRKDSKGHWKILGWQPAAKNKSNE